MIHFFIGTKAQFIKMAPVMVELKRRGIGYRYIDSGQHAELTAKLRRTFGIGEPDFCFRKNRDVTTIFDAVLWSLKLTAYCFLGRRRLREKVFPDGGICLIHGDTLSTLLGMRMAKTAGLKVAHVEAGLRSFCIWHPFPEELIRIYCMKRCDVLFAPSDEAKGNLEQMGVGGKIVKVSGNTVVDSLRLMRDVEALVEIPAGEFALATCHRLETITRKARLAKVVELLNKVSGRIAVVFVTHKPTRKYLKRFGLSENLDDGVKVMDMQDYMNFTALLRGAKAVLTDGGSIQEECSYLNKPCLIIRVKTERPDGLGRNAMLWGFDNSVLDEFLGKLDLIVPADGSAWPAPSKEIVDMLINFQVIKKE